MRRQWWWSAPGLVAAALALSGCGSNSGLSLGRVHGKVTFKGQSIKYGTVSFVPDASKGTNGPIAQGTINEDGSFVLSTSDSGDGAVVGHHRISVVGLDPTPIPGGDPVPSPAESPLDVMKARAKGLHEARAPNKKARAKVTGETFTDRGGRVYRYIIPMKLGVAEESGLEADVSWGSNTVNIDISEDGKAHVSG